MTTAPQQWLADRARPLWLRYSKRRADLANRRLLRDYERRVAVAPPVMVFQMGKVGSSTVHHAVRAAYPGLCIQNHEFSRRNADPLVRQLYADHHDHGMPVDVITLVRQPVDRMVSDFFENYERYFGDTYTNPGPSADELRRVFLERSPRDFVSGWFDTIFRAGLRIDVYEKPFDPQGWSSYAFPSVRLLVLRAELPDELKQSAISEFLGIDGLTFEARNVSDRKRYRSAYQRFREEVRLPEEYVRQVCGSRFYDHFYGPEWLEDALSTWT